MLVQAKRCFVFVVDHLRPKVYFFFSVSRPRWRLFGLTSSLRVEVGPTWFFNRHLICDFIDMFVYVLSVSLEWFSPCRVVIELY